MVRRKAVYVAALVVLALGAGRAQADSFKLTVLPDHPKAGQPIHLLLTGTLTSYCFGGFTPPVLQGTEIVVNFEPSLVPLTPGCAGPWSAQFDLPPLPAGNFSVQAHSFGGSFPLAAATFDVFPADPETPTLRLQNRRFSVDLRWGTPSFGGTADFTQWSDQSGLFWFFDDRNVEVTVKILDGRAINGHFWVFIASMTDVPFTVQIVDTAPPCSDVGPCRGRTYTNPAGKNLNFIDLDSF